MITRSTYMVSVELSKGEYDSAIPDIWLKCPPMKLDTSVPGMEAVRVCRDRLRFSQTVPN